MLRFGRYLAPPRFLVFLILLPIGFLVHRGLFHPRHWTDSAAMAFDLAALVFIVSLIPLLRVQGADAIRRHADANDANRVLILVLTTFLAAVVMAAISGELDAARAGQSAAAVKLIVTLLMTWLFANSVFALHYAHDYYLPREQGGDSGGIRFAGTDEPTYGDFVYFAYTIGMTFQTSDTEITSRRIRAVVTLQSFAAYAFSIGVIAFTINALGGS
jgi:uncharacterized membrane protein